VIRVEPLIKTTVVKDVFNKDGSLWIPKGSYISHATTFETKKFGKFSLVTPNPVTVFLAGAEYLIKKIGEISDKINIDSRIVTFSELNDGTNKFTTEELVKLDPKARTERKLDMDDLFTYLELTSSYLILLMNSVEAFVNQELPNNIKTTVTRNGVEKVLSKNEIELQLRLEDKIILLANNLKKSGYKQKVFWADFRKIKKLRDNLVHLKTKGSIDVGRHTTLFTDLFDLDISKSKTCIVDFMNYFIPNYIREELKK
jgi:hypothetical protein